MGHLVLINLNGEHTYICSCVFLSWWTLSIDSYCFILINWCFWYLFLKMKMGKYKIKSNIWNGYIVRYKITTVEYKVVIVRSEVAVVICGIKFSYNCDFISHISQLQLHIRYESTLWYINLQLCERSHFETSVHNYEEKM